MRRGGASCLFLPPAWEWPQGAQPDLEGERRRNAGPHTHNFPTHTLPSSLSTAVKPAFSSIVSSSNQQRTWTARRVTLFPNPGFAFIYINFYVGELSFVFLPIVSLVTYKLALPRENSPNNFFLKLSVKEVGGRERWEEWAEPGALPFRMFLSVLALWPLMQRYLCIASLFSNENFYYPLKHKNQSYTTA